MNLIADKVISPSQTAFMRGRNILERVVILHESIHEILRKKLSSMVVKIDFEKAYGKVKWPFSVTSLANESFSPKWISWIKTFISGGSVAVNVNGEIGHYF